MKRVLTPDKFLSKSEVKQLRTTVHEKAAADREKGRVTWPKIELMINLGLGAGLRVSELTALQVKDLSLGHEPKIYVSNGKGGKDRVVNIGNNLKNRLKKWIRINRLSENDYLLSTGDNKHYSTMGLQKQFKRAIREANISTGNPNKEYSIHCLRHTFGTYLYEQEKDLRQVQLQLGHSSSATTEIYAGVSKERIYDAMNSLYN